MKLNAKQLRVTQPTAEQFAQIRRRPVYIVLDNVMDTYNIGSIFRLADAFAVQEVILCGGSEIPPSSRIHKAAVGTEAWVPWRYFESAQEALAVLKQNQDDLKIVAVEQDPRSLALGQIGHMVGPMAVVVGHEAEGVSDGVLKLADVIVEIPMAGINKSLNVVVSTGIVLHALTSEKLAL